MKSFLLAIAILSGGACASTTSSARPRPINVHAVRVAIRQTIEATPGQPGPRIIISMGRVTADAAVVYTEVAGGPRREETWVKGANGWTLSTAQAIGPSTTATRTSL